MPVRPSQPYERHQKPPTRASTPVVIDALVPASPDPSASIASPTARARYSTPLRRDCTCPPEVGAAFFSGLMHTIALDFRRFDEISFAEVLARIGVYVIWTPSAQRRPSYIGEGFVADRMTQHVKKFGPELTGYFAAIDGSPRQAKRDAETAEAVLLHVAANTNRGPVHNRNYGRALRISQLGDRHGVMRLTVSGRDPFAPPRAPRLRSKKTIRIDLNKLHRDEIEVREWFSHPWRALR